MLNQPLIGISGKWANLKGERADYSLVILPLHVRQRMFAGMTPTRLAVPIVIAHVDCGQSLLHAQVTVPG